MSDIVSCPYNLSHRVPRSRIQAHLIRCQENYPPLDFCPYNATHRCPRGDMKAHILQCPSKVVMCPSEKSEISEKKIPPLSTPPQNLQKENVPEKDPNHEMWTD